MMMIPFEVGNGQFSVFVILETENLERMKANDPAQLNMWKFPTPYSGLKLRDVIVSTPTVEDTSKALGMIRRGDPAAALEYLSRGFKFKPKEGDNDLPYRAEGKPS
jgi:hypothetical protein